LVRIRLMRLGAKKKPFYRVVIADAKARRNGPFIEIVGIYNPKTEPAEINLKMDRVKYWLEKGAQPSDTVKKLIERVSALHTHLGIYYSFARRLEHEHEDTH